MTARIDKESVLKFLKKLIRELGNKFYQLKNDFEKNPPNNFEIRKRFMEWRGKYDQIVVSTLKEVHEVDEKNFDFKEFIVKITEDYGTDSEFLELLKGVNGSIETLKDFIRINLIKDPTIYEIKE